MRKKENKFYFMYSFMGKLDSIRSLYEKKYVEGWPKDTGSLVAPQTSGARILRFFNVEKNGNEYPEFKDKNITDIWWWMSSLAFELSPSAKKIIVVDPIFGYDRKVKTENELRRAQNSLEGYNVLRATDSEENLKNREENKKNEKEVLQGITTWLGYDDENPGKIQLNNSFAQHIEGIEDGSQDVVFLNFVLDKLEGEGDRESQVFDAIENAYRITKSWGKIYGIHDKRSGDDDIINWLNRAGYRRKGDYKDKYLYFIIEKA